MFTALDPRTFIPRLLFIIPALLIGLVLHEFAHALVAVRLGDPTPKNQGRLSVDPRRHLHPLGTVLVLLAGIGFARPVNINPRNLKGDWSQLAVSLAGPGMNLVIAIFASIGIKLVASATAVVPGFPNFIADCSLTSAPLEVLKTELYYIYTLSLYLMVFNLLPIPPLDGFEIIRTSLRRRNPRLVWQIEQNRDSIVMVFFLVALVAAPLLFGLLNIILVPFTTILGVPTHFPCG